MKFFHTLALLVFSITALSSWAQKPPPSFQAVRNNPITLADYFLLLPADSLLDSLPPPTEESFFYRLQEIKAQAGRTWLYDAPNAYLQLVDTLAGQLRTTTCRLFYLAQGGYSFAYLRQYGAGCQPAVLRLYNYTNQRWQDVTARAIPPLLPGEFLGPVFAQAGLPESAFSVQYVLPRYGFHVKAVLGPPCPLPGLTQVQHSQLYEAYLARVYTAMELVWHPRLGGFQLGHRLLHSSTFGE